MALGAGPLVRVSGAQRCKEDWGIEREGHAVDALAQAGDEGRGKLRKASGSRKQALIRGCPNGETWPG